jgi:RHS repeat-associated protein
LGNIRVSYTLNPADGQLKILEENHYYPFGLKHSNYNVDKANFDKDETGFFVILKSVERIEFQYKYNGKEYQDELSLNLYDYCARNYDPALGRWMNVDPLADERHDISPYNYVQNNPLSRIDPTGMLDTHYEDEFGNTLADTNDGNDATVVISNENSKAFQEDFNNTSVMHQDGTAQNAEWIGKYGDAMVAMPGDNVANWAVDAISGGNTQLDAKDLETNTTATKDGFKINPTGPALILAGQKLVGKFGGAGGGGKAGHWTSVASKSLRYSDKVIQQILGTNYKLPAKGILHRLLGTRGVGAAAGRAVPYLGYILTSYELGKIIGPSKWYGNDDSKWFD